MKTQECLSYHIGGAEELVPEKSHVIPLLEGRRWEEGQEQRWEECQELSKHHHSYKSKRSVCKESKLVSGQSSCRTAGFAVLRHAI